MNKLEPGDWSKYWKEGTITTFGNAFASNYDGEFLDFWKQQLEGQTGHIIDLCCGNGALVWLADSLLNQPEQTAKITGLDIANIYPFKTLKMKPADFPNVKFIGNTSIESLPLKDHSVDMAISQYGFEYADPSTAIPELSRILKPKSKMAFIMHFHDSEILEDSRNSHAKYEYLLGEGCFDTSAQALDKLISKHGSFQKAATDPQYAQLLGRMNRSRHHVESMPQRTESSAAIVISYINYIYQVFDPKRARNDRTKLIADWKKNIGIIMGRTSDMKAAALSSDELQNMQELIIKEGFVIKEQRAISYKTYGKYGAVIVAERH